MFNEANTVEAMVRDLLAGPTHPPTPSQSGRGSQTSPLKGGLRGVAETPQPYIIAGYSGHGLGWHFVPAAALPRQPQDKRCRCSQVNGS